MSQLGTDKELPGNLVIDRSTKYMLRASDEVEKAGVLCGKWSDNLAIDI